MREKLSQLECKALWLLAEHGASHPPLEIQRDPELRKAGELAIEKVWRAEKGMPVTQRLEYILGLINGLLVGLIAGELIMLMLL